LGIGAKVEITPKPLPGKPSVLARGGNATRPSEQG